MGITSQDKFWIQEAIREPGSTRAYVKREFGPKGFTQRGTIKTEVLHKIIRDPSITTRIKRRARLALTLRGLCPFCRDRRHPCKRHGTKACLARRTSISLRGLAR